MLVGLVVSAIAGAPVGARAGLFASLNSPGPTDTVRASWSR
jgi:hypothetical protein